MIEETESETEGDDKEWRECESKSVNQSYIEMFRSSGTAIQMSADEITRPEVDKDAGSVIRDRNRGSVYRYRSLRVRSSVVYGVNHWRGRQA